MDQHSSFPLSVADRTVTILVVTCVFVFGIHKAAEAAVNGYDLRGDNNRSNPIFGNFSITNLEPRMIHLEWDLNVSASVIGFDIFVKTAQTSDSYRHRLGSDVTGDLNPTRERNSMYEINGLEPETEYELFVYALSSDGVVGASERIVFRTLSELKGSKLSGSSVHSSSSYSCELYSSCRPICYKYSSNDEATVAKLGAHPMEFIIVISILIAWGVAFGIFVHKWGTIRIIQPRDYRSKHDPVNLHTIKIVASTTDSVIYRNYSKKYNSTMAARVKKIERMNTMPNIKIAIAESAASGGEKRNSPKGSPDASRFRDTFIKTDPNSAKITTSLTAKQNTPTSTFGTFQLGHQKTERGLMGMPASYIEQLRTTANIMLDLDKKAKTSGHKGKDDASSPSSLSSSTTFAARRQDQDKVPESENMRMVPLLQVVEEDEEQSPGRGITRKTQHTTKQ